MQSISEQVDASRRPIATRASAWPREIAKMLVRIGVQPNQVSVASVVFSIIAAASLAAPLVLGPAARVPGLVVVIVGIQLRLVCNLLDGLMAVEEGRGTAVGSLYNDVPDRLSDPLLFVAAGYACASVVPLGITLGWLAALISVEVSYVRYLGAAEMGEHVFDGPMAKPHRMFALTMGCFGALFAGAVLGSWILAGALSVIVTGGALTFARRLNRIGATLQRRAK